MAAALSAASHVAIEVVLGERCSRFADDVEGCYRVDLLHWGKPSCTTTSTLAGKVRQIFGRRRPGDPAVYLEGDLGGWVRELVCDMPVPVPGDIAFPLMSAGWYLTRVTRLSAGENAFRLALGQRGGESMAEETFERTIDLPATRECKAVRVVMTLELALVPAGPSPTGPRGEPGSPGR